METTKAIPLIDSYEALIKFNKEQKKNSNCKPIKISSINLIDDSLCLSEDYIKISTSVKEYLSQPLTSFLVDFITNQNSYISYNLKALKDYDYNKLYSKTHPEVYMQNIRDYIGQLLTLGIKRFILGNFEVELLSMTPTSLELEAVSYNGDRKARHIEFPYGITSIGKELFSGQTITSIYIPNTMKKIGSKAFFGTFLESVVIPNSVEEIDLEAFSECTHLSHVKLTEGLKKIGNGAFYKTAIDSIEIPTTVEEIGNFAFSYCENLRTISKLSSHLKQIGNAAFNATNLEEIVIPDSIEVISRNAFSQCSNLKKVVLPRSLKEINELSFSLTPIEELSIPDTVEIIGDSAFWCCNKLRSVNIPKNLISFKLSAFEKTPLEKTFSKKLSYDTGGLDAEHQDTHASATSRMESIRGIKIEV